MQELDQDLQLLVAEIAGKKQLHDFERTACRIPVKNREEKNGEGKKSDRHKVLAGG